METCLNVASGYLALTLTVHRVGSEIIKMFVASCQRLMENKSSKLLVNTTQLSDVFIKMFSHYVDKNEFITSSQTVFAVPNW